MHKSKFYAMLTLFICCFAGGQSACAEDNDAPFWINGYFNSLSNSYIEVVSGEGYDYKIAKERASKEIIQRRSLTTGVESTVNYGKDNKSNTILGADNLIVSSRIIDEYTDHIGPGQYKVYLLVQTAKNPTYKMENVALTDKYPFSGRVFVPGMAQIYKGSKVKGGVMIAGTALGIGGIATCFAMKSNYLSLDNTSKATTCANVGYGCIAFTVAMYLYSLIDGIVAPGAKHITTEELAFDFKLLPSFDLYNGAGIVLRCDF
ncbi:MAG: hypothetical protein MJ009_03955 [Paludibacteraceae bacterium]|nr:hypothetical protein [Paludibacteraceae bacterium]